MKKTALLFVFIFLFTSIGFAQFFSTMKREYIYGKMANSKKELIGYFWFDNNITSNGQTVSFKESLDSKNEKVFQSRKYDYFTSDSIYLEKFAAIPYPGGDLIIMIPRIIDGKIQLFGLKYTKSSFYFVNSTKDYFFVKKGTEKQKITKKYFKEIMKDLISDDQVLLDKINNDELTYDNLPQIIQTYNQNNN
jgi:hypothetical protein